LEAPRGHGSCGDGKRYSLKQVPRQDWRTRRELHPGGRAQARSRRQRGALLIELRVRMVGSAGNAPVVNFQHCFMTASLQTAGWITSLENGSGGRNHTCLKRFMRPSSAL